MLKREDLKPGDRLYSEDGIWEVTETGLRGVSGGALDWDWENVEANGGLGHLQKVEVIRAICACGYTTDDLVTLELWNGYGDHEGADDAPIHQVSVWTHADGSIVIADNREQGHVNDHHSWA